MPTGVGGEDVPARVRRARACLERRRRWWSCRCEGGSCEGGGELLARPLLEGAHDADVLLLKVLGELGAARRTARRSPLLVLELLRLDPANHLRLDARRQLCGEWRRRRHRPCGCHSRGSGLDNRVRRSGHPRGGRRSGCCGRRRRRCGRAPDLAAAAAAAAAASTPTAARLGAAAYAVRSRDARRRRRDASDQLGLLAADLEALGAADGLELVHGQIVELGRHRRTLRARKRGTCGENMPCLHGRRHQRRVHQRRRVQEDRQSALRHFEVKSSQVTFTFTLIRHLGKTHNHRSRGDTPWRAQSCQVKSIHKH